MSATYPTSDLRSPTSAHEGEVLVRVEGVSKIFCRDLKKSLLYGLQDSARDLLSWGKKPEIRGRKSEIGSQKSDPSDSSLTSDLRSQTSESRALRAGEFLAVDNVSFELRRGECLGLIGRNGAGKTTLLKMLNGLIKPDSGRIEMRGRVGALIALGAGFNPILSGRENIYVNGSILGLTKTEIDAKIDDIIDFTEIGEFIDAPVQTYSSGMQVRLGFAVATAMEPDVLILDEVLAVGDANFRSKCYQRIGSVLSRSAVMFVSHDAYSVRRICNEVMWLSKGACRFKGNAETGMKLYGEEIIASESLESAMIFGEYISDLTCKAQITENTISGRDTATNVAVSIKFASNKDMELGLCMANVVAPGEIVVGQSILSDILPSIQAGINEWRFTLRDLHLAQGSYSLVLSIYEAGNKSLAINLRHQIRFDVKGSPRYGPNYAPIAYLDEKPLATS
jgi:lipopolysaccharide transport system ATP-binding protein